MGTPGPTVGAALGCERRRSALRLSVHFILTAHSVPELPAQQSNSRWWYCSTALRNGGYQASARPFCLLARPDFSAPPLFCFQRPSLGWLPDALSSLSLLPDPNRGSCRLRPVSCPVSCQLLLSVLKCHCPLQETEVVEDLPEELEDVTTARTWTSQEEVGLERWAGGCSCPVLLAVQRWAALDHGSCFQRQSG